MRLTAELLSIKALVISPPCAVCVEMRLSSAAHLIPEPVRMPQWIDVQGNVRALDTANNLVVCMAGH
jgi:hypothetical protein